MSIAVVGGGMTGIAAAMKLAGSGLYDVTLFEKAEKLGGLSSYYTWEDVTWDRFYHVILSTDTVMLDFISKLGLTENLFWRETRTGFYGKGGLVSMSSAMDFIRFPFMSMWQKIRLAMGIVYCSRIKDPAKLERIVVREWLTRVFGQRVYETIWAPLLRSKLGDASHNLSAAFIWATINRLYRARGSSGSKKEKMGHVEGGYHAIIESAEEKLKNLNIRVRKSCPIDRIDLGIEVERNSNCNASNKLTLLTGKHSIHFDKVLLTVDCPEVLKIIGKHPQANADYFRQLKKVRYLGLICIFMIVKHSLSPYYVINLLDKDLPFTGIIEVTNVVFPESLNGRHIVYLPKYITREDPLAQQSDEKIIALFLSNLKRVFPSLSNDDILHHRVFRVNCVQPLQEVGDWDRTVGFRTPIAGVYLANTSMLPNTTLHNNRCIALGAKVAKAMTADIQSSAII